MNADRHGVPSRPAQARTGHGPFGAARRRAGAGGGRPHRADRVPAPVPAATETTFRRGRARGARRLDPGQGRDAAAAGPARAPTTTSSTRSSPASAAGARPSWPAATSCRWSCTRCRDREALEVALLENVQRQDLTPLEEAEGYRRLIDEFGHTQDELAAQPGQEPQPHRQPDQAARPAGAAAGDARDAASSPRVTPARCSAPATRRRWRARWSPAASTSGRPRLWSATSDRRSSPAASRQARRRHHGAGARPREPARAAGQSPAQGQAAARSASNTALWSSSMR